MGGNLYQRFGIYKDYFATKANITKADLGLYNITGKEKDKYVFKVPSLRNITLTAPYLHDGSASNLSEVIQLMGIYQVGQPIQPYDIPFIIKFLESLIGKMPETEK
jgi:cytochrome c peroxidase